MKYTYPSTILNVLELIAVPFFIAALLCMPLLFLGLDDTVYGTVIIATYGILFLAYVWLRNKRKLIFDFSLKISKNDPVLLLFLLIVFIMICLIYPLSAFSKVVFDVSKGDTIELFSLYAFAPILIGPVIEEFIFRGIILSGLRQKSGDIFAWVTSSFLFAIIHVQPAQVITALIVGLILGFIFIKTNSLSLTVALHMVANFSSIFVGEYLISGSSDSNEGNYLIYGEWTYAIVGFSLLVVLFIFWRLYRLRFIFR